MKPFALIATIATIVLLVSPTVQAHIEKGTYRGKTSAGTACTMLSGGQTFENNVHHPLAERVQITVGSDTFTVSHPAVVDSGQGVVSFNHDLLQGTLPTATGAKALVITMDHSPGHHGPSAYTLIDHDWKNPAGTAIQCNQLQFQP